MLLRKVLLLSGERACLCGGRDNGGIINPLAARRLAVAKAQTPLGTHIQRGETGQVGAEFEWKKGLCRENPTELSLLLLLLKFIRRKWKCFCADTERQLLLLMMVFLAKWL